MNLNWLTQIFAVIRLEMKKSFFARRGLWVYLLALAPVVLYFGHSLVAPMQRQRLTRVSAGHRVTIFSLLSIRTGMKEDAVIAKLGEPFSRRAFTRRVGEHRRVERAFDRYTDGKTEWILGFEDGELIWIRHEDPETLAKDTVVFATLFQYFFLRLAIFFGCVGIFTNLFRGEMLDKSLHYYLLTPMRRELLVIGKFLAGLIATVTIFTASAALQMPAMLRQFDHAEVTTYLHNGGWSQFAAYLGVTAFACLAYGSVFLATGLLFRNPIVPAAIVLLWESANLFLPVSLKQLSLIFYLQSLCPVVAPPDVSMPLAAQLLVSTAVPATRVVAVSTVIILSAIFLFVSALRRKLEINYSAE